MAYRYDESKQRIVYEPEGGPGDDGGYEPDVPDLPVLPGGMAPGFAPEPDPYGGFGTRRNPGGYPIDRRPKVFDPDTGEVSYIDTKQVPTFDDEGFPTGRESQTTYKPVAVPKAPVRESPTVWTDSTTGFRYEYDPYTGQIGQKLAEPPKPAAGKDLRMTESEAGNLSARREELNYKREEDKAKLSFDTEKEANDKEYQDAQIAVSRDTLAFNREKEIANQKQNEITNEINRAKQALDLRAQAALEAYRDQQLAIDRQKIEQAERQMVESVRQFAVVDARMRRQQALNEAEAGQRAAGDYIKAFGYSPAYAGNAPGFGRITPEDVTAMTQPAYRG